MTCPTCPRLRVKLADDDRDVTRLARALARNPDSARTAGQLRAAQAQRTRGRALADEHVTDCPDR